MFFSDNLMPTLVWSDGDRPFSPKTVHTILYSRRMHGIFGERERAHNDCVSARAYLQLEP